MAGRGRVHGDDGVAGPPIGIGNVGQCAAASAAGDAGRERHLAGDRSERVDQSTAFASQVGHALPLLRGPALMRGRRSTATAPTRVWSVRVHGSRPSSR